MQYWTRGGGAQTRAAVRWGSHSEEDFAYLEFSCFTYYFFIYSIFSELSTMTFRVIFTCQSSVQKSYPPVAACVAGQCGALCVEIN